MGLSFGGYLAPRPRPTSTGWPPEFRTAGPTTCSRRPTTVPHRVHLRTLDFGGKRAGSWTYGDKVNGYGSAGCKANWPWKRSGPFTGPAEPCNANFGDVRAENGFYFLAITDYANPAPHNNVFIHNHRKVGMDSYNVSGAWAAAYAVCNPATRPCLRVSTGGSVSVA